MIKRAKELNLKIMLGCMTETSCAITAASHLSPLADWVDLDGAELISNDLFTGTKIKGGVLSNTYFTRIRCRKNHKIEIM